MKQIKILLTFLVILLTAVIFLILEDVNWFQGEGHVSERESKVEDFVKYEEQEEDTDDAVPEVAVSADTCTPVEENENQDSFSAKRKIGDEVNSSSEEQRVRMSGKRADVIADLKTPNFKFSDLWNVERFLEDNRYTLDNASIYELRGRYEFYCRIAKIVEEPQEGDVEVLASLADDPMCTDAQRKVLLSLTSQMELNGETYVYGEDDYEDTDKQMYALLVREWIERNYATKQYSKMTDLEYMAKSVFWDFYEKKYKDGPCVGFLLFLRTSQKEW